MQHWKRYGVNSLMKARFRVENLSEIESHLDVVYGVVVPRIVLEKYKFGINSQILFHNYQHRQTRVGGRIQALIAVSFDRLDTSVFKSIATLTRQQYILTI